MKVTSLLTLAALSAASLWPVTGALAQDNGDAATPEATPEATTARVMSVEQFRDGLNRVNELFMQMRDHQRLAMASTSVLNRSHHEESSRQLMDKALSILNGINKNWGDPNRFATESEDTAFVRSVVGELRNQLLADQLNGRGPTITDEMMSRLEMARERAERPTFRVVEEWSRERSERMARVVETTRVEERAVEAPPAEPAPTEAREETTEETREEVEGFVDTDPNRSEILDRNVVIPEPTTVETTRDDRIVETEVMEDEPAPVPIVPERELPQTGGNPGLLVLLGSGLIGIGTMLRRRV